MKQVIRAYKGEMMVTRGDAFYTLARSIVGQQISVKAADSIWARVAGLLKKVEPKQLLKCSETQLRECGLSGSKVEYLMDLAKHFSDGSVHLNDWPKMSDEEIIQALIAIKGIGRWTAEMFLIFFLMRPDVLPLDDIGLHKGIAKHYNAGVKLGRKDMTALAEKWRPYRSVATWYLWRSLDPVPVEY